MWWCCLFPHHWGKPVKPGWGFIFYFLNSLNGSCHQGACILFLSFSHAVIHHHLTLKWRISFLICCKASTLHSLWEWFTKKTYKNILTATSTCCNANMFMWWSGAKPRRKACVQQITVTDIKDVESKKRSKMTPIKSGSLGRSAGLWCVLRATRGHCWLWKASGWACPLFPRTARPYQAWTGSQCSSVDSCLFVQVKLRRNVDDRIQ